MSETKLPPLQPPGGEVPKASKALLFDEVTRFNIPSLESNKHTHPMPPVVRRFQTEQIPVYEWLMSVRGNLLKGWGVSTVDLAPEMRAFDNSVFMAFRLIEVGYEQAERPLPGVHKPPEWWMWIRDEESQTIEDMFMAMNERQEKTSAEYPGYLAAMQTWAVDRIPLYGFRHTQGAVGTAASEVYWAFSRAEEIQALELQFGQSPEVQE